MASTVPPPPTAPDKTGQSKMGSASISRVAPAKAGSVSSSKNGAKQKTSSSSTSKASTAAVGDTTHVIRVNVLGIAGITVDRTKFKDIGKKKEYPLPPNEMMAVVAVSRGQHIKGTTTLSKPLTKSPTDDVVVASNAGGDNRKVDTTQSKEADSNTPQRHVAVWAMNNDISLGSMVTFEANLSLLDQGESKSTSSHYMPKSFELTVALTESSKTEKKVALPIGIANLNISGDQWTNGETLVIDLPILSLQQARPLAPNKDGLGSFQMISLPSKDDQVNPPTPSKKRNALQRIFGRGAVSKQSNIPSVAERKLFSSAYSTDSSGDAILRVQLQVVEKGSSRTFQNTEYLTKNSISPGITSPQRTDEDSDSDSSTDGSSLKSNEGTAETDLEESAETTSTSSSTGSEELSTKSASLETLDSHESNTLQSDSDDTFSLHSEGSDTFQTLESHSNPGTYKSIAQKGHEGRTKMYSERVEDKNEDDYTLSFNENNKDTDNAGDAHILDLAVVKIFGREVRIPSCGPLVMMQTDDGPKAKFFDDDITHVTGDFFGRDFHIPICSSLLARDVEDDDTLTLHLNRTLSTVSDERSITGNQKKLFRLSQYWRAQLEDAGLQDAEFFAHLPKAEDESMVSAVDGTLEDPSNAECSLQESLKPENLPDGPVRLKLIRPVKSKGSSRCGAELKEKERSMTDSIAEMFRCGLSTVDDRSFESEVPEMVIPKDLDSLDDLTAPTYEPKSRKTKERTMPLPIALGGSGLCSTIDLVDDRTMMPYVDAPSSKEKSRTDENYFSEYDDYSIRSPGSNGSGESNSEKKTQHSPQLRQM